MKRYINASRELGTVSGTIAETGEKCVMRMNGYWVGAGGRHISRYERVDKDVEYNEKGQPVFRQYSMDRHHKFYLETEDPANDDGSYRGW